ncbi:MAG TPA: M2 family metallopeptidase [Thermoanaerobaculia bacterium]|nr:M2 family metallopeptidase [Thermoanaerobaculia bacterium]
MRLPPSLLRPAVAVATVFLFTGVAVAPALAEEPVAAAAVEGSGPSDGEPLTAEGAAAFVERAEAELEQLLIRAERAAWVQANFITHDTEILAAEAGERLLSAAVGYAQAAARFDDLELPTDTRRKLSLLKLGLTLPAPNEPAKTSELTRITSRLESLYGTGKYCPEGETVLEVGDSGCLGLLDLERILADSRDPAALEEAWVGWRRISPPMREDYARMVALANEGARELGYSDVGAMWRSKYDMDPDAFATELERLWGQVAPLYEALHCHVRARLADTYGTEVVPPGEPIPAHLLGNMWSQSWGNVFELVAPEQAAPAYDLTEILRREEIDPLEMVRYGERFFSSLGFEPLPETFWERSLFVKPADREVVCHASAWDVDQVEDLRIKMCIQQTAEDFQTIHHELGHNYYQRAYNQLPLLYRGSANDGFHEAVGDTIALSVTPPYLVEIDLLEEEPPAEQDIALLMRDALDKVAFLPFGLLVDQWRWQVFSGEVATADYNQAWWQLRQRYQGIEPPVTRTEQQFDPGAKYHIPGNTPYTRYFLAHVLQFQFHRALCEAAGYEGPLNRCTIYGSQAAGEKLEAMLTMGQSRPWPDALEVVAGTRRMDAGALIDYFAPLKSWLDEQNAGRQCGW